MTPFLPDWLQQLADSATEDDIENVLYCLKPEPKKTDIEPMPITANNGENEHDYI